MKELKVESVKCKVMERLRRDLRRFTFFVLHFTLLFAASAANAAALTQAQQSYFRNRRICVGRDTTTLPGYVITTWHRNGKPDTKAPAIVTNRLQKIVGKEQSNPLQADAKTTREIRKAAKRAQKNIDKILKTIEQAKKKASDEDEVALYDLLIEMLTPTDDKKD